MDTPTAITTVAVVATAVAALWALVEYVRETRPVKTVVRPVDGGFAVYGLNVHGDVLTTLRKSRPYPHYVWEYTSPEFNGTVFPTAALATAAYRTMSSNAEDASLDVEL